MINQDLQCRAYEQSLESIIRSEIGDTDLTPGNIKNTAVKLSPAQRKQLRRTLALYSKAQNRNISYLDKNLNYPLIAGIRNAASVFTRGAAAGISVAGIVNTIAPGLFSTLCGYLAGSANGKIVLSTLSKAGLVTLGIFTPPAFTRYAILAIGAVSGILFYAIFVFFRWLIRKLIQKFRLRRIRKTVSAPVPPHL